MEYFLKAYKNYANFEGRAIRSEYWYFVLFYTIILIGLIGIEFALIESGIPTMFVFTGVFALGSIIPNIALVARRLHDQDKTGWLQLLHFIPYIGAIVLFVLMCLKGTEGENRYGSDPLGQEEYEFEENDYTEEISEKEYSSSEK